MKVISPKPPRGSEHNLPDPDGFKSGTLLQCEHCSDWFYRFTDYTYWADPNWRPVHWYDFKLKRRIKEYENA